MLNDAIHLGESGGTGFGERVLRIELGMRTHVLPIRDIGEQHLVRMSRVPAQHVFLPFPVSLPPYTIEAKEPMST
jgi:hypothetical protein